MTLEDFFFGDLWQNVLRLRGRFMRKKKEEKQEIHLEREEVLLLRQVVGLLEDIKELLPHQTGFRIQQRSLSLLGWLTMPITGIVAGATGVFTETPIPAGSFIPAGTIPVWTSDSADAVATASADGTQCSVAVSATTTITSFNISVANQDGSFLTTVAVPVTPAPPPAQTGFAINQVS